MLGTRGLLTRHLNFYRVHLLAFTFVPLVISGIFYASNGATKVSYIDSLFLVVSATTVTGLNSALLQPITTWQQVILFLCMSIGSLTFVSIIIIVIRLRFFRRKFIYMIENDADAARRVNKVGEEEARIEGREYTPFALPGAPRSGPTHSHTLVQPPTDTANGSSTPTKEKDLEKEKAKKKKKKKKMERLRADMITRVDTPVRVNEMNVTGWLSDKAAVQSESGGANTPMTDEIDSTEPSETPTPAAEPVDQVPATPAGRPGIVIDDSMKPDRSGGRPARRASESQAVDLAHVRETLARSRTIDPQTHLGDIVESPVDLSPEPLTPTARNFPRTRTIEFRDSDNELRMRRIRTLHADPDYPGRKTSHLTLRDNNNRTLTRTSTYHPEDALVTGFGGFPNPIVAAAQLARSKLPVLATATTMPRTTTLASVHSTGNTISDNRVKPVSYISFDAVVGRNSKFHNLTAAQQEELGGVEYRALTLLLKIVVAYWLLFQLIGVLIVAPWLTHSGTYEPAFANNGLHPTWYVFFQVFSAFSNNGMSLDDSSMIPFQRAYLLIVVMCFLILGGNTAYPVFLRLCIWILSKWVPRESRTRETLQFLLDHPRRCFVYLFPSHQTWFLAFALVVLNSIDWVAFLVLDIGNPEIEAIPVGTRVIDGLLQSFAVRAAGFTIVSLANVAPALQLLYVVMMYIAVYPIALSVRTSNVYEEKSMGIYEDDDQESEIEAEFAQSHSATKYIGYHARKQLAFDMWWLVLGLWLLCIIERTAIVDAVKPEINIFSLMFEMSSAYGTVGLSLGYSPTGTSLAGGLRTLSKLVLIFVMIRGRHRGLPIAIDRAVLLPSEIEKLGDDSATISLGRRNSRATLATMATRSGPFGSGEERRGSDVATNVGGLDAVEPETDEARARRLRSDSEGGAALSASPRASADEQHPQLGSGMPAPHYSEYAGNNGQAEESQESMSSKAGTAPSEKDGR